MDKLPLITVITVSYNAVSTIEQTILSVINQTYYDVEYIIIDGGSTDGTVDIIRKYEDRVAYWVSEPDKGIYDAMNKGVKRANGGWINFMNAGDSYYDKSSIKLMVLAFHGDNTIYYGDAWVNSIDKKYWGRFSDLKLATGNICHQTIFYPSSVLKSILFDINYCIFADYAFNLKVWKECHFEYIPQIVCYYDFGGASMQDKNKDKKFMDDKKYLIISSCGFVSYCAGVICRFLIKIKASLK